MLLSVVSGIFFSCESEDNVFDFELENKTQVQFKEINLPARSIFIDSLRTDNETTIIVGNYNDSAFGDIEAKAYCQLSYSDGRVPADTLTFDSLQLRLNLANFLTNDTDSTGYFYIYNFREDLLGSVVYLKDMTHTNGVLVDSVEIKAGEYDQNIRVRADHLGARVFNLMAGQSSNIIFEGYTLNLAIIPKEGNQSAMTFNLRSDSSLLVFYSHYDTLNYTTELSFNGRLFSNISNDYGSGELNGVTERTPFDLPENRLAVNSIFGLYNYLDLADLQEFASAEENENIIINRALITTDYSTSDKELVDGLRYYFYKNGIGFKGEGVLTDPYFTVVLTNQSYYTASQEVLVSSLDKADGNYASDITFFIESYYNHYLFEGEYLTDALVATPNSFVTLQESNLGDTKLKLYYTIVE